MAIIAIKNQQADVNAPGSAMDATMNFSGAMFDMLATVYVNILMAAIREPIQNGVDAVKRKGMTAAEGVLVTLPTTENPVITVVDKGDGMTKAFMESTYLSFGSSTKAGDNGAAGGLGVGRWAAYGYIRECFVVTCNAEDMVERTYFQFEGKEGRPQVQCASELPGSTIGTKVFFPVKESDIDEALRAVAWLKDIMQLTMGDSFSVDNPAILPEVLPEFSGTVLNLDDFDPGLKGVRIYPFKGDNLKYGRQSLQTGSLVVLTNQEAGVGGLPFHVQSPSNWESVFHKGMVVEIPMSFSIPFMPSREELKYTDEVNALLHRIDAAAAKAIVAKARELFDSPLLEHKGQLSNLVGNSSPDNWHWFSIGLRAKGKLEPELSAAIGAWNGNIRIQVPASYSYATVQVKAISTNKTTLKDAFNSGGNFCVSDGKGMASSLTFSANNPIKLVINDLKAGGTARLRQMVQVETRSTSFLYLSSENMALAKEVGNDINASFDNALDVIFTSSLPEVARVVVGKKS